VKVSRKLKVRNALGLHARPAAAIVRLLQRTKSAVAFQYRGETVNARSIMSLLMLAAPKNAQIEVTVSGDDAEQVLLLLAEEFEQGFGEP